MRKPICLSELLPRDVFVWRNMRCQYARAEDDKVACLLLDYGLDTFYLDNTTTVQVEVQDRQFSEVKPGDFFTYEGEDFIKTNITHKFGGHVLGGALRVLAPKGSEKRMELFFPTKKVQECTTNYKDF